MAESKAKKAKKTQGTKKVNKTNKKVQKRGVDHTIIGLIICTGLLLIVVSVACALFTLNKSKIENIADFKQAVLDERALNCTVSSEKGGEAIFQASEWFKKLRMVTTVDGVEQNVIVKDGVTYMWSKDGGYKMNNTAMTDAFLNAMIEAAEEETEVDADAELTFNCISPRKSDFRLPEDVTFTEVTDEM